MSSIYEKLMNARKDFHSISIVKTGYNKHAKYSYFELSDFLIPAMNVLGEYGLVPVISFQPDIATMTVYDIDSEATIVITSPMSEATLPACQPVQSLGGVETYQRRYLWVTLLEIVEHDAIDKTSTADPDEAPPAPATDEQMATINEFMEADSTPEVTKEFIRKRKTFTQTQAQTLIDKLNEVAK